MSDLEQGGASTGASGGSAGAAPTTGSSRPEGGRGYEAGGARGSDGWDGGEQELDATLEGSDYEGEDGEGSADDGEAEEEPDWRERAEAAERRAQQAEERIKKLQGPRQQAEERARRAEQTVYREAYQQAVQRRTPQFQREDAEFGRAMAQAEYALSLAGQAGDHQRVRMLQDAMQRAKADFDRERRYALRDAEFEAKEAFLRARAERFRPYERAEVSSTVTDYYRVNHGIKIPPHVLKHAETERESWLAAWIWADNQRQAKDARRLQGAREEAQEQDRAPKARTGGGNTAALRARLKELEGSGNLAEAYELRRRLGSVKTQRVRVA